MQSTVFVSVATALAVVVVTACGDERPDATGEFTTLTGTNTGVVPPRTDGGGGDDGGGGGGGGAEAGRDASFDASICQTVTLGEPIIVVNRFGDVPFAALGGEIATGTYMLQESYVYSPATSLPDGGDVPSEIETNVIVKKAFVLDGAGAAQASAEGTKGGAMGGETRIAGVWSRSESSSELTITGTCAPGELSAGYTASATGLVLFPAADRVEMYRRLE